MRTLVTGAASGIGRAICLRLARDSQITGEPTKIALVDIKISTALRDLEDEIRNLFMLSHIKTDLKSTFSIKLKLMKLKSALLKQKNVNVFRDVQEKDAGKNAIIVDPDDYMISLFEPNFSNEKDQQTAGYVGFTPA